MSVADVWELTARAYDPTPDNPLWTPQAKQRLATDLAEEADETLYGGAAGGGKTEWLIAYAAEECERYPRNRWAIFRRVFPSLSRTVMPRAKALLYGRAVWNGGDSTFTWPNGSVLQLAHLQHADSVLDHQGAEYGGVGFEELTEFQKSQYEFLLGRLRAPADGIRPHAIATTNPGGPGHAWVKRRFIKPREVDIADGEAYPQPMQVWRPRPSDEQPVPGTRVFIPASITDNPALLRRDPGYLDRLRGAISNRGMRLALEKGDWDAIDAVEGALWEQGWLDDGRLMKVREIDVFRRVVAIDPSDGDAETSDEYGVSVVAKMMDGTVVVEHSFGWFGTPYELAKKTVHLYHEVQADAIVVEKNHGGLWVPTVLHGADEYANVVTVWASKGKITRAEPVAALFEPDESTRLRYRARLVGFHPELEEQMTTFTGDPGDASPNRLDAMVWGVFALTGKQQSIRTDALEDERLKGRR